MKTQEAFSPGPARERSHQKRTILAAWSWTARDEVWHQQGNWPDVLGSHLGNWATLQGPETRKERQFSFSTSFSNAVLDIPGSRWWFWILNIYTLNSKFFLWCLCWVHWSWHAVDIHGKNICCWWIVYAHFPITFQVGHVASSGQWFVSRIDCVKP